MSASIDNNVITLSNGTKKVIDYIDLFDENTYGAGNLFIAGRIRADKTTNLFGEVKTKIEEVLNSSDKVYDYNRLNQIDKKFLTNDCADKKLKSPNRAKYRIQFLLRIHFYGDFGYLNVGVPWQPDEDPAPTDTLTPPDTSKFAVLNSCWLSEEEVKVIKDEIKPS